MVLTYNIDIAISLAWIGLSLTIVVTGLLMAWSRIGRAASLIYLGGLMMLAATAFRIYPALVRAPLSDDARELKETVLLLREERDQEMALRGVEATELAKNRVQLKATLQRIAQLEEAAKKIDREIEAEREAHRAAKDHAEKTAAALADVERRHATLQSEHKGLQRHYVSEQEKKAQIQRELGKALQQLADANGREERTKLALIDQQKEHATILNQLEAARKEVIGAKDRIAFLEASQTEKPKSPNDAAGTTPDSRHFQNLTALLDAGLRANSYTVSPYGIPDLIKGRTGHYYRIELRKAPSGQAFIFKSREYTFSDDSASFETAFKEVAADILSRLELAESFEIFIRGRADSGGSIGPLPSSSAKLRNVRYLLAVEGVYDGTIGEQEIVGNVNNNHLPLLRAASARELIVKCGVDSSRIFLLEGKIVAGTDESQRTVDLFLRLSTR